MAPVLAPIATRCKIGARNRPSMRNVLAHTIWNSQRKVSPAVQILLTQAGLHEPSSYRMRVSQRLDSRTGRAELPWTRSFRTSLSSWRRAKPYKIQTKLISIVLNPTHVRRRRMNTPEALPLATSPPPESTSRCQAYSGWSGLNTP